MNQPEIKNWREFFQFHKDRAEYNANAEQIQKIIDPKDNAVTSFSHLVDHPSLVVLSKSLSAKEIQATFYHSNLKPSLLSNNHEHTALSGFGKRACAMKIDAKELFRLTSQKKKVPTFEQIMKCNDVEDIGKLPPAETMTETKLEAHAILSPFLTELLFSEDSFQAVDVLDRFIVGIKFLKTQIAQKEMREDVDQQDLDPTYENMDEGDVANASVPVEDTDETSMEENEVEEEYTFDNSDREYEKSFGRVLQFLWGLVHEESVIKPTRLSPCAKISTEEWLDKVHDAHFKKEVSLPPFMPPTPTAAPPGHDLGLNNAATAIHKLSDIWGRKIDFDEKEKENKEKKKKEKGFDKLSNVQKNTFTLITATVDDSDENVKDLKPTEDMMTILEQTVGIKAQSHLQYEFNKHKHMCDIGLAMCTQMKNGIITSHPSVNDINGISPLFLPDQAVEDRLGSDLALRLEEQLVLGKISDDDLKIITKCKIYFPKNFGEYLHVIRNFHRLIIIVAGSKSIFADKLEILIDHAIEHERCYKDIEREYFHIYASILDHIHRRSQHFIHSAGLGLVSKLKFRKLDFMDLLEEIEDGDYTPSKPKWLRNNKKRDPPPSSHHQEAHNDNSSTSNRKKKKVHVENPKFDADLKCPEAIQYRVLFHPGNRRGVEEVKHEDGSTRCNNWFHRGWCIDTCPFKESHSKKLTANEKSKCKDYLNKLVEKHKKWAENASRRNSRNEGQ